MPNLILTTPEELKAIVSEAVSEIIPKTNSQPPIDTMSLSDALTFLLEHGYPTSKGKMYKLTSSGDIPCKRYGNKLVFSRKELLEWAERQTTPKEVNKEDVLMTLARSARRKR